MVAATLDLHLEKKEVAELKTRELANHQKEEGIIHEKGKEAMNRGTKEEESLYLLEGQDEQRMDPNSRLGEAAKGPDEVRSRGGGELETRRSGDTRGGLSCFIGREGEEMRGKQPSRGGRICPLIEERRGERHSPLKDNEHGTRRDNSSFEKASPLWLPAGGREAAGSRGNRRGVSSLKKGRDLMAPAVAEATLQIETRSAFITTHPSAAKARANREDTGHVPCT